MSRAATNTTRVPSATTKSPGDTAMSPTVIGTFVPVSTIRPRAVRGVRLRANSGKP